MPTKKKKIVTLEILDNKVESLDNKVESLDNKIDSVDKKIDGTKEQLDHHIREYRITNKLILEEIYNTRNEILTILDGIVKQLQDVKTDEAANRGAIQRHEGRITTIEKQLSLT